MHPRSGAGQSDFYTDLRFSEVIPVICVRSDNFRPRDLQPGKSPFDEFVGTAKNRVLERFRCRAQRRDCFIQIGSAGAFWRADVRHDSNNIRRNRAVTIGKLRRHLGYTSRIIAYNQRAFFLGFFNVNRASVNHFGERSRFLKRPACRHCSSRITPFRIANSARSSFRSHATPIFTRTGLLCAIFNTF
jgi:hypothetical protein